MLNKISRQARQTRKFRNLSFDEAIKKAARLRRVVADEYSGWADYVQILNDYVDKAKRRKTLTRLDIADDDVIAELKLLDHEIWFIENYIKIIPTMFISGLDKAIASIQAEEDDVK